MEQKKDGWGGHRQGSGRKKLHKKRVTILLTEQAIALLQEKKNKSKYIEELILNA